MRGLKPQHVIYIADHLKKVQGGVLWGEGATRRVKTSHSPNYY